MKTLLILTVLVLPHDTATTTRWFADAASCAAELVVQKVKPDYVNGACVELVKPIKQSLEAPHG